MKAVYDEILKISKYPLNVLLLGESGTGKEVICEYIHYLSLRKSKKLIKLNCSALPESLIESELFGYMQGSFSGAFKTKAGIFEYANDGTLFLDEIGDLSSQAQAKILRAVDGGFYKKVGSNLEERSDFRLICATNKNLRDNFRNDLYYRIAETSILIPPLRERKEDLIDLCNFLLKELIVMNPVKGLNKYAQEKLLTYSFPGNIRELKSMLKRAVFLTPAGAEISDENIHLNLEPVQKAVKFNGELDLEFLEKKSIERALETARWVQKNAAKLLNISPRALNYKCAKLGITHESWRKYK